MLFAVTIRMPLRSSVDSLSISGRSAWPGWLIQRAKTGLQDGDSCLGGQARGRLEDTAALDLAAHGIRSSVVGLPRTVHGEGDRYGFIARMVGIARDKGVCGYVGDGSNRWPAVHVVDAAYLFRLAVERAPAGSRLHAVGDDGVPTRDIAAVIGRHLNLPAASVPAEEFGFLGRSSRSTTQPPAR